MSRRGAAPSASRSSSRPSRRQGSARSRLAGAAALATLLTCSPARADNDPDPWFGEDKVDHFAVSAGIAAASYAVSATALEARGHALLVAGGVTVAIGAGKEALDAAGFGTPSWKDFAWDVMGTIAGLGLAWSVDLMVRGVGDDQPAFAAPHAASRASGSALVVAF